MVADTARRGVVSDGLRPINMARDWRDIVELIRVAFGDALDLEAQRALDRMQPPPLLAPLVAFLDQFSPPGESMMPGFVWVQGGRVVGTASARRISPRNRGWLISNVAVHPDWQGRGIGRALLEAALDYAQTFGGAWATLQVRDSNRTALALYESLGFRSIGQVVRLRLRSHPRVAPGRVTGLRPAGWLDGGALSRMAQTLTPHDMLWADILNRELYRTEPLGRLANRLHGCRRHWWVVDDVGGNLKAAVGIEVNRHLPWHRLRLFIPSRHQSQTLATGLIEFGLAQLAAAPPLPVEIEHPAADQTAQVALEEAGFEPVFSLIHMRLDL